MDGSARLRVGVIGLGSAGQRHVRACLKLPDVRVASVLDSDTERRDTIAREIQADQYAEPSAAFWESIDAVTICVPHGLLAEFALEAISYHKPLLLEKPMAITLEDADSIINAADRAGVQLMIGFVHRFRAEVRQAHEALLAGQIGTPMFAVEHLISGGGTQPNWVWSRSIAGGGVTLYNGVHGIDRLRWFLGSEVATVFGESRQLGHDGDVEDLMLANLTLENGSAASYAQHIATYPLSSGWRSEIYGTTGALLIGDGTLVKVNGTSSEVTRVERDDRFQGEMREFVSALRESRPPSVTGADGRAALAVALAMYESARVGQPVKPAI